MKNGLKNTLIFLSGAVAGGAAATFALRAFYNNFINETLNTEINNELENIRQDFNQRVEVIKDAYEEKLTEIMEKVGAQEFEEAEQQIEEAKKETKKSTTKKTTTKKTKETKETKKAEATDYTQYSEGKKKKTVKDVRTEAMKQIEEETTEKDTGSYITSLSEFTEDNSYDKITLTYWKVDNVYTDDLDNPDMDAPNIIGSLIDKYDDYGDGESLYVRNDEREIDFEIIYNTGSYAEFVSQGF